MHTYVDEVDIGKIQVEQRAVFSVEAAPSLDMEGKVVSIFPKAILKENVVYYEVIVEPSGGNRATLHPEMTANVSIFLEPHVGVLVAPTSAVKRIGRKSYVYR